MITVEEDKFQSQVKRILQSDELRNSEALRRLLNFLAEKTSSGEMAHLKEYIVAIDGLGKPPSYDPSHNSAVRIQVGRLRQKLGEYYRHEGKDDSLLIDVPKGQFKLTCHSRFSLPKPSMITPDGSQLGTAEPRFDRDFTRREANLTTAFGLLRVLPWLIATVATMLAIGTFMWTRQSARRSAAATGGWTPELSAVWDPFVHSPRPLILAIEDPLFIELRSGPDVYYRDKSLNTWKDVTTSHMVAALRGALGNADIQPSRYYTAFGEVDAAFLLGKLLGSREQNFSVIKTSQLSWQQLADNNVLFVGVQNLFFNEQLQRMPLKLKLIPDLQGIENIEPRAGEPRTFVDQFSTAPAEEGVVYALITHLPGPLGNNDVESFTSNRSAGYVAAVQWFTDPNLARTLATKLRAASGGRLPRFYQVLLRVKFKDEVPLETTYVTSRKLR